MAVLVGCLALLCTPAVLDTIETRVTDRVTSALQATAGGLTVVTVAAVLLDRTPWPRASGLPGYDEIVASVFLSQTALLAALGLLTLSRHSRRERQRGLLRGMGAPVLSAAAAGLAVAFSANLVYRTAYFLNRHALTDRPQDLAPPPLAYKWAIFGFLLAVIAAAVVGGAVTLLSRRTRRRAATRIVAHDFPAAGPEAADRMRQVEKAIARARFTERLGPLAIAYACLAGLGLAASALGLLGLQPSPLAERLFGVPSGFVTFGLTRSGSATWRGSIAACCSPGTVTARCCWPRPCCSCRPGSELGSPC